MTNEISARARRMALAFQRDETDSAAIYDRMAKIVKDGENAATLESMAADETSHARKWSEVTGVTLKPSFFRVRWFSFLARFLGLTFAVKLLENGEKEGQDGYLSALAEFPEAEAMVEDERRHERELIAMIDEERLKYAGSVVLGLNDALVELTGALAGFSFAFQNTRVIALTGLITGISAAFSMASSEYLSQRSDGDGTISPLKSALYTGIAYIFTVALLVLPFFLLGNYVVALACTLAIVVAIILGFNFYLCTAKDLPFRRHFLEMLAMSMGVTLLSFGVGLAVKRFIGVEM